MSSQKILILCLVILALWTAESKPIYNFKKSYVNHLTPINFKDQVEKIRQNTNYVAIVHYYKYNGNPIPYFRWIQLELC